MGAFKSTFPKQTRLGSGPWGSGLRVIRVCRIWGSGILSFGLRVQVLERPKVYNIQDSEMV